MTFQFPGPGERAPRRPVAAGPPSRARRVLIPTAVILILLVVLFGWFADFYTELLWYRSLQASSVFTTRLSTELLLFFVAGIVVAALVVGNIVIAYRVRPSYRGASLEQQSLDRYRDVLVPRRRLVVIVLSALVFIFTGMTAAGHWKTYLQWRHGHSFGVTDPQFHMDVSFYAFDLPFYRFVLGFAFAGVAFALIGAAATHYIFGGIRLQTPGEKTTAAAQVHVSVLLGIFLLLKAVAYWLDRYELTLAEHTRFTGASFTDIKAVLPGKTIMTIIALICAVLFFSSVVRRTWLLPGVGLGLLVLSTILVGGIYPAIIQQVQVKPSEASKESPYIERNIEATRIAYGIDKVEPTAYDATTIPISSQLQDDAETVPGIRLLDPTVVSPTFEQLQQVRGFYSFPDALDVDRYMVDGQERDTVIAVRELDIDGIPESSKNWLNQVTTYTHGFGIVAANGNQRNADGSPVFSVEDIPPVSELGEFEPRVYFGQNSPPYSIVGAPAGATAVEFDIPEGETGDALRNTYDGKGGVPIGSLVNKLLYAVKYQQTSIFLSNRVNADSKILYDRDPRQRVQKVAPWLSVDGDPYPAIVNGRIQWILDGYTTVDGYPYAQRTELDSATTDSTTAATTSVVAQAREQVNYIRNSVKATVDAYDGTVTLYAWYATDPVLQTWMDAFPGLVHPKSEITDGLMAHLRYPEDLFKVQREMIAKYHVTDPQVLYGGQELWQIPDDPTSAAAVAQPPYYLSIKLPGQDEPTFSLTTSFVPNKRSNLQAFIAVDAEATSEDYGTFRLLELPGNTQIPGPQQVANTFESDPTVAQQLSLLRAGDATVVTGNLLTLPVGGGLLYVQPVYVERASGTATYPLLQRVLVSFGGSENIGFASTLQDALNQVFSDDGGTTPTPGQTPTPGGTTPPATGDLADAIADAQAAYAKAQADLKAGDFAAYGADLQALQDALDRAAALSGVDVPSASPTSTSTPSPAP